VPFLSSYTTVPLLTHHQLFHAVAQLDQLTACHKTPPASAHESVYQVRALGCQTGLIATLLTSIDQRLPHLTTATTVT
jgi:hypothetical protein